MVFFCGGGCRDNRGGTGTRGQGCSTGTQGHRQTGTDTEQGTGAGAGCQSMSSYETQHRDKDRNRTHEQGLVAKACHHMRHSTGTKTGTGHRSRDRLPKHVII